MPLAGSVMVFQPAWEEGTFEKLRLERRRRMKRKEAPAPRAIASSGKLTPTTIASAKGADGGCGGGGLAVLVAVM